MDNEKYLNQLVQELRAKQEKEKDITAAAEYASNLLKLHLPVIFDRKHFAFLTGCELTVMQEHTFDDMLITSRI